MDILHLADQFHIDLNMVILGIAAILLLLVFLIILILIRVGQTHGLKKRYKIFMQGEDAKSLEKTIQDYMEQMKHQIAMSEENAEKIRKAESDMENAIQKVGLVKYDAFNEMGGKLSFSLAMLNQKNDGFIINAMHSREGCYTYIKEIVDGGSVLALSGEEQEALDRALNIEYQEEV